MSPHVCSLKISVTSSFFFNLSWWLSFFLSLFFPFLSFPPTSADLCLPLKVKPTLITWHLPKKFIHSNIHQLIYALLNTHCTGPYAGYRHAGYITVYGIWTNLGSNLSFISSYWLDLGQISHLPSETTPLNSLSPSWYHHHPPVPVQNLEMILFSSLTLSLMSNKSPIEAWFNSHLALECVFTIISIPFNTYSLTVCCDPGSLMGMRIPIPKELPDWSDTPIDTQFPYSKWVWW